MVFPYLAFRNVFSSNENIEDRIDLLGNIFANANGLPKMAPEDLEAIAYLMETRSFSAQEIIFR